RFRQTKGAVKLHLLLDHEGYLPVFALITEGTVPEVNIAHDLSFPKGSILAIDRGYTDYSLFARWTETGVYFVTRQKNNASYRVMVLLTNHLEFGATTIARIYQDRWQMETFWTAS
ncbi:MAG: transposase, partial [Candidatus Atribacteria bacterium]|nr:transposase [Candidatus Atribacteria bacterium]